jgi:hypothetical protein
MIIWIYTEHADSRISGPFVNIDSALTSPLWEYEGTCVWMEEFIGVRGWYYENVKWCGDHWLVTSQGTRPIEPERPAFLTEAIGVGRSQPFVVAA